MPFNTRFDLTQPPWNGQEVCMNLTHEEVLHVKTETQKIIDSYVPGRGMPVIPDDNTYVVPRYNELDWTRAINGNTYAVIKYYDTEVNKLGVDENGIIYPPVEEETQPVEEDIPMEVTQPEVGEE